jgi:P-type E1-E2 ATPase
MFCCAGVGAGLSDISGPVFLIQLGGVPVLIGMVKTIRGLNSKVMGLTNACRLTPMVQGKWVRAIASYKLVPGDVIVLQPGRALCDMVLLQGACLVTESMLSGEVRLISNYHTDADHMHTTTEQVMQSSGRPQFQAHDHAISASVRKSRVVKSMAFVMVNLAEPMYASQTLQPLSRFRESNH